MSAELRIIKFTLNGEPATADVAPHHNLVELLQRFGLFALGQVEAGKHRVE